MDELDDTFAINKELNKWRPPEDALPTNVGELIKAEIIYLIKMRDNETNPRIAKMINDKINLLVDNSNSSL